MNNVIKIIQIFESKVEDIQPDKNLEKEVESLLGISYQNNYKAENLDIDVNGDKVKANKKKLA